ncbi:MAG TPA: hypothetical protein VNG53_02355 [Bacteroidia bacterium]|nr:hypothetical protein [Bacteroidia bacterium]
MKITKNNYELFFLDYYEGNLQAFEIGELMLFLEQHLDLKTEFKQFEIIPLTEDKLVFFNEKSRLKKSNSDKIISEYDFVNYIENTSSPKEKEIFISQISKKESLKRELDLFEKTILQVDKTIAFENKKSLKRIENNFADYYKYFAVAASLALFIGIAFLIPKKKPEMAIAPVISVKNNNSEAVDTLKNKFSKKQKLKKEIAAKNNFQKNKKVKYNLPKLIKQNQAIDTIIPQTVAKTKIDTNSISIAIQPILKNKFSDSLTKIITHQNPKIASAEEIKSDTNIVTLKQMVAAEIRAKLYGDTLANKNKISIKNLIRIGFKGIQKATNNKIQFKEKINNGGDITAYTVTAGIFEFSHISKK